MILQLITQAIDSKTGLQPIIDLDADASCTWIINGRPGAQCVGAVRFSLGRITLLVDVEEEYSLQIEWQRRQRDRYKSYTRVVSQMRYGTLGR